MAHKPKAQSGSAKANRRGIIFEDSSGINKAGKWGHLPVDLEESTLNAVREDSGAGVWQWFCCTCAEERILSAGTAEPTAHC